MSSHQNSAFDGESAFELVPPSLGRARYPRATRSQPRPLRRPNRAPEEIWGQYNNYRSNGVVMSAIIHAVLIGLLLSGVFFGHQIVQQVAPRQTVTLIAPSPDTYALPTAKKVVSGGGGGGDHDPLPAPKGRLPKVALQQITPPAIIMRNEKPESGNIDLYRHARGSAVERNRFRWRYRFRFRRRCRRWPRTWRRRWQRWGHWWRCLQGWWWHLRAPSHFCSRPRLHGRSPPGQEAGYLRSLVDRRRCGSSSRYQGGSRTGSGSRRQST